MKRALVALAVTTSAVLVSGCFGNSSQAPTTREECISQGYEWEEDSEGGECDTDDDESHHKVPKPHSTAPTARVTPKSLTSKSSRVKVGGKSSNRSVKARRS
jgi:hypothetical protein